MHTSEITCLLLTFVLVLSLCCCKTYIIIPKCSTKSNELSAVNLNDDALQNLNGDVKYYLADEDYAIGRYKKGIKTGTFKYFYQSKLYRIEHYKKGVIDKRIDILPPMYQYK